MAKTKTRRLASQLGLPHVATIDAYSERVEEWCEEAFGPALQWYIFSSEPVIEKDGEWALIDMVSSSDGLRIAYAFKDVTNAIHFKLRWI